MKTDCSINFKLYSSCIPVNGFSRTAIIDLKSNSYIFVPNILIQILNKSKKNDISNLKKIFSNIYDLEIDKFFDSLVLQKFGFYCNNPDNFPKLSSNWNVPYHISNLTINFENIYFHENNKPVFPKFNIDCLGIILHNNLMQNITFINNFIQNISFNTVQLFIYSNIINVNDLIRYFPKLTHIYIINQLKNETKVNKGIIISYILKKQFVNSVDFIANIPLYIESQKHNTYFNRKLYIGVNGEIKNSSETTTVFGNINNLENTDDILAIIKSLEFQKYWYVHKGLIDVCKQCEFRHMCVDNRVPVKRNDKEWYMETECNYNPYIAKWQGEEGYKSLTECGVTSNQNGFNINRKKVNAINKELWGD